MRIAFLCSCLEPGRDGVGDYTRFLAAECIRQGHQTVIISLNDKDGSGLQTQTSEEISVSSLRCSSALPWPDRIKLAQTFLGAFQPDRISLQFVPYGFHPKGMPWHLANNLSQLIGNLPLQIMFHELWISPERPGSFKERIIRAIQRQIIFRMIRSLKPRVVHTSNLLYVDLLKKGGVAVETLPLFGNIPITPLASAPHLPKPFASAGIFINSLDRDNSWWGLFFGTLHPAWEPEPLIPILLRAAQRANKRLCLIAVGRLGAGASTWETMQRNYDSEITFVKCGEQSPECISTLLQCADFGIAASPLQLIGKSGTAVAMFEHGLPVICSRDNGEGNSPSPDPLLYRCDATLETRLVEGLPKRTPTRRVSEICTRFLSSLTLQ